MQLSSEIRSKLLVICAFIVGVLVSTALTYVFARRDFSGEPESRPLFVPVSAIWAGGADGGQWIDCLPLSTVEFKCEIYADTTGELIERGEYLLSRESGFGKGLIPTFFAAEGNIEVRAWLVRR